MHRQHPPRQRQRPHSLYVWRRGVGRRRCSGHSIQNPENALSHYTIAHLRPEEHHALRSAIVMGALAARQETLRTLIAANRDHSSVADSFERELNALERATHAIVDAKYVD